MDLLLQNKEEVSAFALGLHRICEEAGATTDEQRTAAIEVAWLRSMETTLKRRLEDNPLVRGLEERGEVALAAVARRYAEHPNLGRALRLLQDGDDETHFQVMKLVESVATAVIERGDQSLDAAAHHAWLLFVLNVPELRTRFIAADFKPAVQAWRGKGGNRKAGGTRQWPPLVALAKRIGYSTSDARLAISWSEWRKRRASSHPSSD